MTKSKTVGKRKIGLIALAVAILTIAVAAAVGYAPKSRAQEVDFPSAVAIKSSYALGESLTVADATLSDGETEYAAKGVLVAPSGKAYSNATVILSESGRYVVRYTAIAGNKRLTAEKSFNTVEKLFAAGKNTTVSYATGLGQNANRSGLKVNLASGEKLRYAKAVNLTGLKRTDNLISLIVLPENRGTAEISRLYIDFVDAYDPTNVVRLTSKANTDAQWPTTYSSAGATGQPSVGLEKHEPSSIIIDGEQYQLHVDDDFGMNTIHSFTGITNEVYNLNGAEIPLDIAWDYAERRIYTTDAKGVGGLVTDLDDTALYDDPWKGFTTGEVYVEVSAGAYSGSTATILFTELCGEDLTATDYLDDEKPVLNVDLLGYDEAPAAQVGKAYTAFAATAFDVHDGKYIDVEVSAYYNYGSTAYAEIQLKDGKFVPDRTGEITLVYVARDAAGNTSEQTVTVPVVSAVALGATVNDDATSGKAGTSVKVGSLNVTSLYPDYQIKAEAVLVSDETVRYTVDPETLEFTPLYAGEYRVEYTVIDFIEYIKVNGMITVAENEAALILGEASLPRYFIKNATYSLPALAATAWTGGKPISSATDIYVSEDGAERVKVGEEYTVYATASVKITYVSASGAEKSYDVPVKDVGYGRSLNLASYFDTEGFTATAERDGIVFKASGDGEHTATFINPVLAHPTRFEFSIPKGGAKFDKLLVTLTDSENLKQTVTLVYEKNEKGVRAYVEGGIVSVSEKVFKDGTAFAFNYDNENRALYADRTSDYTTRVILPDTFEGFSSKKVYISFEMTGAESRAAVKVSRINNQLIDNSTADETEPQSTVKSRRGRNAAGTVISLDEVVFCDVLDPNVKATLKVTSPDKTAVADLGGALLDGGDEAVKSPLLAHEIKLDAYGRYSVAYTAIDGAGNAYRYTYAITVADVNAPVITLSDAPKTAKVGDTVKIATATVTDDLSKDLTAEIYLTIPDGRVITLDGTAFKATVKGRYLVTYYATDEVGNISIESYSVVVE